jgi:hypothetical protein
MTPPNWWIAAYGTLVPTMTVWPSGTWGLISFARCPLKESILFLYCFFCSLYQGWSVTQGLPVGSTFLPDSNLSWVDSVNNSPIVSKTGLRSMTFSFSEWRAWLTSLSVSVRPYHI